MRSICRRFSVEKSEKAKEGRKDPGREKMPSYRLQKEGFIVPQNYGESDDIQGGWGGSTTGNGKKLSSSQAQLGQATCLAVAYFPSISCGSSTPSALYAFVSNNKGYFGTFVINICKCNHIYLVLSPLYHLRSIRSN